MSSNTEQPVATFDVSNDCFFGCRLVMLNAHIDWRYERVQDDPPCQRPSDEEELRGDAERHRAALGRRLDGYGCPVAAHTRDRRRGALGLRDHRLSTGVEARHPPAPERGGV